MYSVLFFYEGGFDNHLRRLITNLSNINPKAVIDFMTINNGEEIPSAIKDNCRQVIYYADKENLMSKDLLTRHILRIHLINKTLKRLQSQGVKYDAVNIHFPLWEHSFCIRCFKRISNKILITPWGSDVYRISKWKRFILSHLYHVADNISGIDNRFTKDVIKYFRVPYCKFVNLNMGSDVVDYIYSHISDLTQDEAKKELGIPPSSFTIAIGYNASPAQRHFDIIKSLSLIKESLPSESVLLLPLTYGGGPAKDSYMEKLERYIQQEGFKYEFFTNYLSQDGMFKLMRASNMFIHAQISDADSGSVKEFLLSGSIVLNGAWLSYDDLDRFEPRPYYAIKDMSSLPDTILLALSSGRPNVSTETIEAIRDLGWSRCITAWDSYFLSCAK